MDKVFACPVCHGQMTVSRPPNIAGDQTTWVTGSINLYPCPTCKATGVVWGKSYETE